MLLLLACTDPGREPHSDAPPADSAWTEAFTWVLEEPLPCPVTPGPDDATGDLAEALGLDLEELGIPLDIYRSYGGRIQSDPSRLSHFHDVQQDLTRVPCHAANRAARADAAVIADHPITRMLADATVELDLAPTVGGELPGGDLVLEGVPDDLAAAVARIVAVAEEAAELRNDAFDRLSETRPSRIFDHGPNTWLAGGSGLDPDDADEAGLFSAEQDGRLTLMEGGLRLAQAIDEEDWASFAGGGEFSATVETSLGLVLVRGDGDDVYDPSLDPTLETPVLFAIDTGGNDTWRINAGASADGDAPVGIAIDLGGDDLYGYVEVGDPLDTDALLPADADGRTADIPDYGPISESGVPRQGAGLAGYGFLLDLGGGNDTYRSLRISQGFAAWGVGVLWDDGGNDSYTGEAGVQGAAWAGVALAYDGGGDDTRRAFTMAQAHGFLLGSGTLYDAGGADSYELVVDEQLVYYSPQTPTTGNSSMGQGCAFGWRRDSTGNHYSGGLALLRDVDGDDTYEASTFAQGAGYWMGTGALVDSAGNDTYDGLFYTAGAAAHFAIGVLLDASGDDVYGAGRDATHSVVGLGHDFSVAVLVDGAGDDTWVGVDRSLGAAKCHGLGLLVDRAGDDTYTSGHRRSIGWATDYDGAKGSCGDETTLPTYGLFVDLDGTDTYSKPEGDALGDDTLWLSDDTLDAEALEYGGGLDGTGRDTFATAW